MKRVSLGIVVVLISLFAAGTVFAEGFVDVVS